MSKATREKRVSALNDRPTPEVEWTDGADQTRRLAAVALRLWQGFERRDAADKRHSSKAESLHTGSLARKPGDDAGRRNRLLVPV